MDYSMYYSEITYNYFWTFFGYLVFSFISISAIRFLYKHISTKRVSETRIMLFRYNLNNLVIYRFLLILATVTLLYTSFSFMRVLPDIGNIINQDYMIDIGTVVGWDSAGREDIVESRGIEVLMASSGKKVQLTLLHYPIRKDEVYRFIYLPASGCAAIIEKIE